MSKVGPNEGHRVLARWEKRFARFSLITQNIDGLHRKAGSNNVVELHGNIWRMRCTKEGNVLDNLDFPLPKIPPSCPTCGGLLRPDVVWFGEALDPEILKRAFELSSSCEVMFSIGTSALVQPAASLPIAAIEAGARLIEINPEPTPLTSRAGIILRGKAGEVLALVDRDL